MDEQFDQFFDEKFDQLFDQQFENLFNRHGDHQKADLVENIWQKFNTNQDYN